MILKARGSKAGQVRKFLLFYRIVIERGRIFEGQGPQSRPGQETFLFFIEFSLKKKDFEGQGLRVRPRASTAESRAYCIVPYFLSKAKSKASCIVHHPPKQRALHAALCLIPHSRSLYPPWPRFFEPSLCMR